MGCIHVRVTPVGSMQSDEAQRSLSTSSQLKTTHHVPEVSRQSSPEPIVVFRNKPPIVSNEPGISTAYVTLPLRSASLGNYQNTHDRRNLVELGDPSYMNSTTMGPTSVKSHGSSVNGAKVPPSLVWDSNVSDISEDSRANLASDESEERYETYGPTTKSSADPEIKESNYMINRFFLGKSNDPSLLVESELSQSVRCSNVSEILADSEGSVVYQPKYRRIIPIRPKNYVQGKIYDTSDESVESELQDVLTEPSFESHEVELMRCKLETALRSVSTKLSKDPDHHHQKFIISETTSEADEP